MRAVCTENFIRVDGVTTVPGKKVTPTHAPFGATLPDPRLGGDAYTGTQMPT